MKATDSRYESLPYDVPGMWGLRPSRVQQRPRDPQDRENEKDEEDRDGGAAHDARRLEMRSWIRFRSGISG